MHSGELSYVLSIKTFHEILRSLPQRRCETQVAGVHNCAPTTGRLLRGSSHFAVLGRKRAVLFCSRSVLFDQAVAM